ncbi:hypothetical protein [Roseibium alexandrii]|uniref:Uncharacterized protein n=1 Tax=Roseibium alexandrii (strain DSM 17067 / NCIMB 14079 / DFL-11) TaxID=244592 RepID=A0A5E8H0E5_ROSAD|nr:hypothetical protein [Roseibium alexandrii]EEE45290.1 hypothetical protein SADFL11_2579 [Roseibium alexandrii DFL-11]
MSAAAEEWAVRAADALVWPDPCLRRQVLLALAARHVGGAFQLVFAELADHLELNAISLWMALMELRRKGLIDARFGPVMTITLAIDFPTDELNQPAEVSALPRMSMEGAE